ncbi:unnamed protein product [Prorocentrum cordatum]|uniref:Uncharacterized protein n=1 Tax=Prorocentrum cordatum TaxID=2364126 RepID=A0ABN9UPY8_9DINO|nr:unnamed protein product [Polarella glacialis]
MAAAAGLARVERLLGKGAALERTAFVIEMKLAFMKSQGSARADGEGGAIAAGRSGRSLGEAVEEERPWLSQPGAVAKSERVTLYTGERGAQTERARTCGAQAPSGLRLHLEPSREAPCPLRVLAVIDPLGQEAQRLPPVLRLLHEELNAEVRVLLRPVPMVSQPLVAYYRAAPASPAPPGGLRALGDWDGSAATARFSLPPRKGLLLSMQLDTPEAWLVSAVDSGGQDLDSLSGEESGSTHVRYKLEALFIEGWARMAGQRAVTPAMGGIPEVLHAEGWVGKVSSDANLFVKPLPPDHARGRVMSLLRPEVMCRGTLVVQADRARVVVDAIGGRSCVQFEDMNALELQRPYRKHMQRLDELERVIRSLREDSGRLEA